MTLAEKEKIAIQRLKAFEPETEPYYLCYSGGKDSDCIRILAELAGVKHEIYHNLTTVDAPETIAYIKSIPNVIIEKAYWKDGTHKTMWNLIPRKKMPPTRLVRYCCSELKEWGGKGRLKITGVRWAESLNRKKNQGDITIIGKPKTVQNYLTDSNVKFSVNMHGETLLNFDDSNSRRSVEFCYRTTSTMLNPIIDWTDSDVWEFLHHYSCEGNPLYQCGNSRIGCIGCPLSGSKRMKIDFAKYPKYKQLYINAFDRMVQVIIESGKYVDESWRDGEQVMKWWLGYDPNQLSFFDQ